jgi:hypothetical protein
MQDERFCMSYHQLPPSGWVKIGLHSGLGIKGFIGDRVPTLMLLLVYEAFLLQQELHNVSYHVLYMVPLVSIPMHIPQRPCDLCRWYV